MNWTEHQSGGKRYTIGVYETTAATPFYSVSWLLSLTDSSRSRYSFPFLKHGSIIVFG